MICIDLSDIDNELQISLERIETTIWVYQIFGVQRDNAIAWLEKFARLVRNTFSPHATFARTVRNRPVPFTH